jgi:hypothetical protein
MSSNEQSESSSAKLHGRAVSSKKPPIGNSGSHLMQTQKAPKLSQFSVTNF